MGRVLRIVFAGLALALACAGTSAAAWTRFSPPAADSASDQMGVARTSDGALHVVWVAGASTTDESLLQTSFTASGHLGPTSTVSSGWSSLNPAGLAVGPDGHSLNAFWGGIVLTDPNHQEFNYASSADGGSSWTLAPYDLVTGEQVGTDAASVSRLGNTFLESWGSYVHVGTGPAPANHFTASPADDCCGYAANVAAASVGGSAIVAWYSNQTGHDGVYIQRVDPATGQPQSTPTLMPGTGGAGPAVEGPQVVSPSGQPDWLIAYGTGQITSHRMLVWVAGSPHPFVLGSSANDINEFTLADGPGGRVWAAWAAQLGGQLRIVVRRSNPTVSAWGSPVVLAPPKAGQDVWTLSASGIGGALDVLAGAGDQGQIAEYQTRVLPGLTFMGPSRLARGRRTRVTFHVTDAGAAVHGAGVSIGGVSGRTNSHGSVTLSLGPFSSRAHRVAASATAPGYTPSALVIRLH